VVSPGAEQRVLLPFATLKPCGLALFQGPEIVRGIETTRKRSARVHNVRAVVGVSASLGARPDTAVADGKEPLGPHLIASSASINTVVYGFHVDIVKTMRSWPGAFDEKKRGIMYGP
jgi:hypothetical protein